MTEQERLEREAVVQAAKSWLGTPFHNCAQVKGRNGGVDCAHLLARAYSESGVTEDIQPGRYPPAWFMHRDEERFVEFVERYAVECAEEDVGPGDTVIYRIGRCFAHGAIVVDWPHTILHAHLSSRQVTLYGAFDGDLAGRQVRFFTMWPKHGEAPRAHRRSGAV